jgi:hypothetical protein
MPIVTLPDGTKLVGPKADEFIKAQAKAKSAAKKKLMEAKKAGDEEGAAAAAAVITAAKPAHQSNAEAFQEKMLKSAEFKVHTLVRKADPADKHTQAYIKGNLKYDLKDAPELHLFECDDKRIVEVHPNLLKKSGKMAIEIPVGAKVAVVREANTAQRMAVDTTLSNTSYKDLMQVIIIHYFIVGVITE